MNQSPVEEMFVRACSIHGIPVVINRTTIINRDWQIDFSNGNRRFTVYLDGRDGFVFSEQVGARFIKYDQGCAEPALISDQDACTRAAALLIAAQKDKNFRGFEPKVI